MIARFDERETCSPNESAIFSATAPTIDGSWQYFTSSGFTATQSSYTFVFSTQAPSSGQDQSTLLDEVHLVRAP